MAEIIELDTPAKRSRESVDRCMQKMIERHGRGQIANVAQVYWLTDGTVKLYITDGMTLANLAFAVKSLDFELTSLMGSSYEDPDG